MLKYYVRHQLGGEYQQISSPPKGNALIIGHVTNPSELQTLAERYELNPSTLRDVLDRNELPRVEYDDTALYVFVRLIRRGNHGRIHSIPVLFVLKKSVLTIISASPHDDHWTDAKPLLQAKTTSGQLVGSLAAVVNQYEEFIRKTGQYIADTGGRLRTHEVTNQDFIQFATLEENLNEYHTNLTAMRAVAKRLQLLSFSEREKDALEDIVLYVDQLLVATDSHARSITSIRSAYSTIANNILNHRVGILTAITVLITLPNVFFGMYGMNVALPFETEPWAYPLIVGVTIAIVVLVYLLAKRFKIF